MAKWHGYFSDGLCVIISQIRAQRYELYSITKAQLTDCRVATVVC